MAKKTTAARYSIAFEEAADALGVKLDARGLVPLAAARGVVRKVKRVERDGNPDSDTIWAALLSLQDGAEFSLAASRIEWTFPHLRGWDNEDAVLRYGAGALPWLEAMLDALSGKVGSIPPLPFYFVGTHLLAIGPEAAGAVLRVERDGDADPDGLGFVGDWLARHGAPAWVALARRALDGDVAAKRALGALANRSPSGVRRHLGKELATRALGGEATLQASTILGVLDAAASADIGDRVPWPTLHASAGHFEYHAMRVIAVRGKKGDDWGILVELVQGDRCDDEERWPAVVQRYVYGSGVPSGGVYLEDSRPIGVDPKKVKLDARKIRELDLRPGRSITGAVDDWASVLAIRATLATKPGAFFPPARTVVGVLGVPSAEVLLETRELEHVDGPRFGTGTFARPPSKSPSWRSIAEVIVTRDPKRLVRGRVNTDWRDHAKKKQKTGLSPAS